MIGKLSARRILSLLTMAATVSFVSYATQPDEHAQVLMSDLKFPEIPGLLPDLEPTVPTSEVGPSQHRPKQGNTPFLGGPTVPDQPVSLPCDPDVHGYAVQGAMVGLDVSMPCAPGATLRMTHGTLMFDVILSGDGHLSTRLPALSTPARILVETAEAARAQVEIDVPDVTAFRRTGLQWIGPAMFEIHALEFGAEPGSQGHITISHPGPIEPSEFARGGFITRLGDEGPELRQAAIYSVPAASLSTGVVRLSVQAPVTPHTCDKRLSADALQTDVEGALSPVALMVEMPSCDNVGDILVLKNLLHDMRLSRT